MAKNDKDNGSDTASKLMKDEELISRVIDKVNKIDDKMDTRFDNVDHRLGVIDQTILRNALSLEEHMRRTDLLERAVTAMESRLTPIEKQRIIDEAIKQHKWENLVRWGKIIATLAALAGLAAVCKPLLVKLLLP